MDVGHEHDDHRPLGWGVLDFEGMRTRFISLREVDGDAHAYVSRFWASEDPVDWIETHVRVTGPGGATQIDCQHLVNVVDSASGLVVHSDRYGGDQIEDARAMFEATVQATRASGALWNVAVQTGGNANTWAARGDRERFATCLSDDLVIEATGSPLIGDAAELHDPVVAGRLGFGVEHRRVFAVRGERLALTELRQVGTATEPFHQLVVEEIDDDCRIVHVTHFAPTSLADAMRHLELRWIEVEAPQHDDVIRLCSEFSHALAAADGDRVGSLLADDCRVVDHRELAFPDGDTSWLIDFAEANGPGIGAPVQSAYVDLNDRGRLTRANSWRAAESGEVEEAGVPTLSIVQVTDGRISAIEFFPEDQFDAARARFEELTGAPDTTAHEPWNEADAVARSFYESASAGDWSIIDRTLSPDVTFVDQRSLHGYSDHGIEAVTARQTNSLFGPNQTILDVETVAIRGERLVLHRVGQRRSDDPDGPAYDSLILGRLNGESLADLTIAFDPDDIAPAMKELDRLSAEIDEALTLFEEA